MLLYANLICIPISSYFMLKALERTDMTFVVFNLIAVLLNVLAVAVRL